MLEPAPGFDLEQTLATFGEMAGLIQKNPYDLSRYTQIINSTLPTLVIETGTDTGASADWFADHVLAVVTIDTDKSKFCMPKRFDVECLYGSSTSSAVFNLVQSLAAKHRVMVSLDSDHSEEHVRREIELYAPLVSLGCYLVIEDGIFDLLPCGFDKGYNANAGVLKAIEATMLNRPDFARDFALEGMFPITGSPAGWWRRVQL